MSPRQTAASIPDSSDAFESSFKSRNALPPQRNSRRSNSAMSNARTRGSAGKDESESEIQAGGEGSDMIKDEATTAEAEEDEDENENAESGDSVSSATQTNTRGRRKPGGKRRRGGGAVAGSRTRTSRGMPNTSTEEEEEETKIKAEVEDEEADAQEGGLEKAAEDEGEEDNPKEDDKSLRHRSVSGFKELAGLGLRSLGDGEEEPLVPRRTRRGAISPNEGGPQQKNNEEEQDGEGEESHDDETKTEADDTVAPQEFADDPDSQIVQGEDETAEEGVTRCLCGSADENVGLMIQCETCKCWQHCICMGMRTEEDCPDVYFCEQCRPEQHIPLLRLLSVLPASRNGKRSGSKTQSGRVSAKDAAKELKEAKEAVLTLAKENEKRRKEGREPVTGWTVAQEQELQGMQYQEQQSQQQTSGLHRRQVSETGLRASRSHSREELSVPKSPPKRRSTMNSRDSAYGWESIPPGLLNDEDEWASKEGSEGGGRKRKRVGTGEEGERHSPSPVGPSSSEGNVKRRRTSSAIDAVDEGGQEVVEEEEDGVEEASVTNSQISKKGAKARVTREQESTRPKHPNQYTARRAAAAAAAAVAAGLGTGGSGSPSPSPSKHRMADGSRKTTSLRDVINNGSRMATPTPNGSQSEMLKSTNPGATWGMPEHLSHLAYLLPTLTGPEPLKLSLASTKGMPSTSSNKNAPSTATKDSKTDRIIQASPQPFQLVSVVEPNTKIKFPGKRTTMGEMKKRVRNILDFVSRLQIETAERERRRKFLGIQKDVQSAEESSSSTDSKDKEEQIQLQEEDGSALPVNVAEEKVASGEQVQEALSPSQKQEQDTDMNDVDASNGISEEQSATPKEALQTSTPNIGEAVETEIQPEPSSPALKRFTELQSTSMSLVDELTRELLSFQQRYGMGTSSTNAAVASSGGGF